MYFMLAEEHSYKMLDNGDLEKAGSAQRERLQEAVKEAKEGAVIQFTVAFTVGRKPVVADHL